LEYHRLAALHTERLNAKSVGAVDTGHMTESGT
jgi:hypothetical protein